jgi:prolyl-tRNA synthetase
LEHTSKADNYEDFKTLVEKWFVLAHWDWTTETALKIQEETKATIRCIPFDAVEEAWVCVYSGKPSTKRVLFAKAY